MARTIQTSQANMAAEAEAEHYLSRRTQESLFHRQLITISALPELIHRVPTEVVAEELFDLFLQ